MISVTIHTNARYSYYCKLIKWVIHMLTKNLMMYCDFGILYSLCLSLLSSSPMGGFTIFVPLNYRCHASNLVQMSLTLSESTSKYYGNTRLFVIINIDLDLYQWPRSLPTSYLWAIGPPRKQGFFFVYDTNDKNRVKKNNSDPNKNQPS